MHALKIAALSAFLVSVIVSCSANFSAVDPSGGPGLAMNIAPPATASTAGIAALHRAAGTTTATSLQSLKVKIVNVMLASNATLQGSGFQNPRDPMLDMYGVGWGKADTTISAFTEDEAKKANAGWIDLMSASDVAMVQTTVPVLAQNIGQYRFAMVSIGKFIKWKVQVAMNNGVTLYTKSNSVSTPLSQSGSTSRYLAYTGAMTNGPAEEILTQSPTDHSWFRLLRPFTVTEGDLRANKRFKLFLAFDPVGAVAGFDNTDSSTAQNGSIGMQDSAGNIINIPVMDIAAVVYKEGTTVVREVYKFTVDPSTVVGGGTANYDIALEVFVVPQEGHAIAAVITRSLVNSSGKRPGSILKISESEESGSSITFYSPTQSGRYAFITGFKRLASGVTGTLPKVDVSGGESASGVYYQNVPYTLVSSTTVAQ